ncbi:MAG: hypothetical protein QG594_773, partial [Bacteroidota bacterium]|nr:hypothetical protein [Bacteroidota bacterium]
MNNNFLNKTFTLKPDNVKIIRFFCLILAKAKKGTMKSIFIKLDKPCSENWETMKANESGRFCEQCSKTVVDFTTLNPFEIGQKMKMAKGNICARVSQNQLNEPLLDFEAERKRQLPYSNLAAGLMMATTMAANQPLLAKTT